MTVDETAQGGKSLPVILALGTTQTIAWASSYYLPAILAAPIARDLGITATVVFAALSAALVIAGLLGPRVGHVIDTVGGRGVLAISNLVLASGLAILSVSHGLVGLSIAWLLLGVGMGMGLYEAAFATLTRIYGTAARRPITGITLIAGFASTVGWPASTWLDAEFGWRIACQVWALVHLALALPLNLLLPRADALPVASNTSGAPTATARSETFAMIALAYIFAATGFVSSGLSALLPTMLVQFGATPSAALFAGMLIGPSQVAARIIEAGWLVRYHPLISARLATLTNPLGVIALALGGPIFSPVFAVFYGAGNGILTIARGTLPLALFGPQGFGRRVGVISLPARATGALAPLAIGLMVEHIGTATLWVSALASLSAFAVLMMLHGKQPA
jgi:MFS family permease